MRTLITALALGLTAFAAQAADDPLREGKKVYRTKTCMACHGIKGQRPVLSYPALAGQNEKYMIQQMQDIKSGERVGTVDPDTGSPYVKGMADIMHLISEDEMKLVAKYLAAQDPGAPKELEVAPTPEQLAAGEKAYKQLGCRSCHGKDAMKAPNKMYPTLAGLHPDYLVRAMTEMRDKVRTNGKSKLMFGTIKKASDEDIAVIAAWLAQLDRSAK